MQSYTQPLLDAVFTTEYILKDGAVAKDLTIFRSDDVPHLPFQRIWPHQMCVPFLAYLAKQKDRFADWIQ